ncbi:MULTISPECIES: distal tail protein Dit [Clostridia]|uniref:distal tail protein Dit n=1 Tax=Clostridia TaxID=186801 RepID=UPI000EA14A76|nr:MULTISPECIES: distal tail protein Dit [Clostridia]NBJ71348.1 hypothetical protein [Roseburia sp. 1XD42-34]RKI74395.1 hypothetical protein D7V87_18770 [Clostridium sp. 1xD42-85]
MYGFVDLTTGSVAKSTSFSIQTVFNGTNLDQQLSDETGSFVTLTIEGRGNVKQRIESTEVPGMDGALEYTSTTYDVREIAVKYKLSDRTNEGFRSRVNRLNSLLRGSKRQLRFTDEDAFYYATLSENTIPEEESNDLIGTLTFICSDPFKYGKEHILHFESDVITVTNKGTAEVKPVIEMEVLGDPLTLSPFVMVQNQEEQYMLIGEALDVESSTPYQKYERVMYSDANALTGWTTAATGEVDGLIAGKMEAVKDRFQAASYGSGSGWHGPAVKQSLPEALQDFRLNTWITLDNSGQTVGRIELYLLDVNGNQVAKVAMKDVRRGERLGYGEARVGGALANHFLISEYGDRKGSWNNFAGILRIEREGNMWSAFFGKGNAKNGYHTRRFAYWRDTRNKYNIPVAQVVVHMGQYGKNKPCTGGVYSISVEKINQVDQGTPVIVRTGDFIKFDTRAEEITINGEPRTDIVDFGTEYFGLKPGDNQLVIMPNDSFKTTIKYRDTFR